MYLFAFTFWNCVMLFIGLMLIGAGVKLAEFMANLSERLIVLFTQTGLHGLARTILALAVGYDQHTYEQSRFLLRNQVHVRFKMLWGIVLAVILFVVLLRQVHLITSISTALLIAGGVVVLWRLASYYSASRPTNQHVKELEMPVSRPNQHYIRQWDYLDELFAAYA